MASYEQARPDYRVHEYFDGFYKLVKFINADRTAVRLVDHSADEDYDHKLDSSYSRAKSVVLQLALCNEWDYFFTGTLNGAIRDRYALFPFVNELMQWLRDLRKQGMPIRCLFVYETHKDGAWHIHGMLSGLPDSELCPFVPGIHPQPLVDGGFLNWPRYSKRFGFCSLGRLRDRIGAAFYITKYVSKDLAEHGNSRKGAHLYTASRPLRRSRPYGDIYGSYSTLDRYLTDHNEFCSTGFVECKWSDWLDYIDLGPGDFDVVVPVEAPAGCPEWEQMILVGFCNRRDPVCESPGSSVFCGDIPLSSCPWPS